MKTYFLAWESDNKKGHSIYDFADHVEPREALKQMIKHVEFEIPESKGPIQANQFNRVD